jgi:hypothetical protein
MAAPGRAVPGVRHLSVGRGAWLALTGAGLLILLAAALWPGGAPPEWPVCFWRHTVGIQCPGCGLGHSVFHFLRGDWAAAWRWHPLVFWFAAQGVALWGMAGWSALAGRRIGLPQRVIDVGLAMNVLLLLAAWARRLPAWS